MIVLHGALVVAWSVVLAAACGCLYLAWVHRIDPTRYVLLSVGFVSLCSIYALIVTHAGALAAELAKRAARANGGAG